MSIRRPVRAVAAATALALAAAAAAAVAPPVGAESLPTTRSNTSAISIPDSGNANPYPSTINASGLGQQILDLTVSLVNVTHSCSKDLDVLLVAPDGTKTTLMSDNGEVAINLDDCNNISGQTIVFDDDAGSWGTSVPGGSPITFRPSDNDAFGHQGDTWSGVGSDFAANNLSTFDGKNPNGAWKLYVTDDAGDDSGTIAGGWSITVVTTNGPPSATNQGTISVLKGEPKAITLGGTDPDGDSLTCQPSLGAKAKGVVAGSGCNVTYTANTRASGGDTFTFTVRDSVGQTSPAGQVSVGILNRPPIAIPQDISVPAGSTIAVALTGSDPDPGESLALTCNPQLGATSKGSVSGSGCFVTYKAGDETGEDAFAFQVSDGFGGSAGGTIDVTITPKTLPGCTDADPQNARYVCRVYLDLLGRAAEPAGKAYWVNRLNAGESRQLIARQFIGTIEYRRIVVKAMYQEFLGRAADASGIATWAEALRTSGNPDTLRASLLGSTEFYNRAGKSADGFAAALYQKVVRRPAITPERNAVAAQIAAGTSRQTIAANLLKTTEADTITIASIYERFLRRSPPPGETTFWVDKLQAGSSEFSLTRQVMSSTEYFNKA